MIYRKSLNRILLITGEISGDIYGALLIKMMKRINPGFQFTAIGGPRIRMLGVENLFSAEKLALIGLPKFSELKKYWFVYKTIKEFLKERKVDLVILIDFPGFNLKIAKIAKKMGYPVIYYVAPQVWAWNKGRIKIIKKYVDRLYVILPFEKEFFQKYGIDTVFLGHPLVDLANVNISKKIFNEIYGLNSEAPIVSFFPGSREAEVEKHIPFFLKIWEILKKRITNIQGIMVRSSGLSENFLWREVKKEMIVIENTQYEVLRYSTLSVLASGTVTLESAIMGTPAVVVYKVPLWLYHIGRYLVKVPYISLPNLILEKEVYPEFIYVKENVDEIVNTILTLFKDSEKREKIREELQKVREKLGPKGATLRIAEDMVNYIHSLR